MTNGFDLKLPHSRLRGLVDSLMSDVQDYDAAFASIAWSVICEPGDGFAGLLIESLGAAQALSLELTQVEPSAYAEKISERGSHLIDDLTYDRFAKALNDSRQRWRPRFSLGAVEIAVSNAANAGGWFLTPDSAAWPAGFADLGRHQPRGIWGLGNQESLALPALSLVGSRMATNYGEFATAEMANTLVQAGYATVSGGAYGIDSIAHRATLSAKGDTVAIMAGGLDRLYPSGNGELFSRILVNNCLISELPPGAEPTKWRFLQRNRLIAAAGLATVVVEASPRSGAVSTANRAVELGRPLGAVPGPINSPTSQGCHDLIRNSLAQLISRGEDALELVGNSGMATEQLISGLGALETRVLDAIGFGKASSKQIAMRGGLTVSEVEIGLASLRLLGLIGGDSNGWKRQQ